MNKLMCLFLALCCCGVIAASCCAAPDAQPDLERLLGRWVRPDGGYVIDIRAVQPGGTLDAAYFNPTAIHVSRAEWQIENGTVTIFIELNDTNYPGATYKLHYDPESEQLAGEYFQPLLQQTFAIYFVRETEIIERTVASS